MLPCVAACCSVLQCFRWLDSAPTSVCLSPKSIHDRRPAQGRDRDRNRIYLSCGSVLQCVAVCCNVLRCVAVCCRVWQGVAVCGSMWHCVALYCSVLQCVAVCYSVLRRYAIVVDLPETETEIQIETEIETRNKAQTDRQDRQTNRARHS